MIEPQDDTHIGFPTPDTSHVVDSKEVLARELQQVEGLIGEIEGNIATMHVQLARTKVIHGAILAGQAALEAGTQPVLKPES